MFLFLPECLVDFSVVTPYLGNRVLFLHGLFTLRARLLAQFLYTWKSKTTLRMDTLKVAVGYPCKAEVNSNCILPLPWSCLLACFYIREYLASSCFTDFFIFCRFKVPYNLVLGLIIKLQYFYCIYIVKYGVLFLNCIVYMTCFLLILMINSLGQKSCSKVSQYWVQW